MKALIMCVPLLLTAAAWIIFLFTNREHEGRPTALIALAIASLNAVLAFTIFFRFHFHPLSAALPPWQDPEILDSALLGLTGPIAIIVAAVAGVRRAPLSLVLALELASFALTTIGCFASAAV
jgi:hypothetical protein